MTRMDYNVLKRILLGVVLLPCLPLMAAVALLFAVVYVAIRFWEELHF